jgi:hypothetical protein
MTDSENLKQALAETWQKIPQEERTLLLAKAKAQACEVCCLCAVCGIAVAVSLHAPWVILGTLAFLPLLYQVVSTRLWLELKPLTVARYFLASMTSRLYAKTLHSSDPSLKLIFRGSLQSIPLTEPTQEDAEFESEIEEHKPAPKDVWISLFPDSLVMITEGNEGAELAFGHSTLKDFEIALDTPENENGEPKPSRLVIQTILNDSIDSRWVVSSPHTTMLLACERKIRFFNQRAAEQVSLEASTQ